MRKKLRVVLDVNVLISASFRKLSPIPNSIYQALKSQQFILVTSPSIIEEIEDVLSREKIIKRTYMIPAERKKFLAELIDIAVVVSGDLPIEVIKADPDDDKFLAAAIEGGANYIVSGDRHLLDLREYEGIKILTPNSFLKILEKQRKK